MYIHKPGLNRSTTARSEKILLVLNIDDGREFKSESPMFQGRETRNTADVRQVYQTQDPGNLSLMPVMGTN